MTQANMEVNLPEPNAKPGGGQGGGFNQPGKGEQTKVDAE